ncbi:hypothetical protein Ahy_A08g040237 [Arachis hypogaea]|uniref:Uncharacterized protein n=1 Tax=Arachis hypogaea TaxID=3818 RepID=A0A445BYK1_ARAHY|nr:hypothetical protein Ahy_A08g040237 [Arachis hypogaea]
MLPQATNTVVSESSHKSEPADFPLPPPIIRCTLYGTMSMMLPSGRYTTIEWVGGCNRCRRMLLGAGPPHDLTPSENQEGSTDEGFRQRRLTNRANKISAKSSKYTGDSATFMKTKTKLSKSLNRDVTLA